MKKTCPVCHTSFQGRIDKQFCSDDCRAEHHNQERRTKNQYLRQINVILKRNRDILQRACPTGRQKVKKAKLLQQGFQYGYFTGQYETQQKHIYYYCYDYGYQIINEEELLIVKLQPYVQQHLDTIIREDEENYGKG